MRLFSNLSTWRPRVLWARPNRDVPPSAVYADKILKGEKPGDIPVEEPTKFEFLINLSTAKTLGLTVPRVMQMMADIVE